MPTNDYYLVLVIFTAVTAFSLLLQACCLLVMAVVVLKAAKKMQAVTEEVKGKALPVIASAQTLLDDVSPKLRTATSELSDLSQKVRHQAQNVNQTMDNALVKANAQIHRIDEILTTTINAVDHASRSIESAVASPTRRISGIIHGVRVGLGVFLGKQQEGRVWREPVMPPEEPLTRPERTATTVEFPHQKQA
jgi:DNA anti-recombination protein RmuC